MPRPEMLTLEMTSLAFFEVNGATFSFPGKVLLCTLSVTKECKERKATRTYDTSVSSGCCAGGALFREMRGVLCVEELLEARGAGGTGTRRVTTIGNGRSASFVVRQSGNQTVMCLYAFALSHRISKLTSLYAPCRSLSSPICARKIKH